MIRGITRTDQQRVADAYAAGLWVHRTLADELAAAAESTPQREVLIDGTHRVDCAQLHRQASAMAHAMAARMPTGSVVSFMLPNWHEAAVVYLGATLAGMVVNPILPSLRDRELSFILEDADTRMIVIPGTFRGHDYAAMLSRVTADLPAPPEVVVVRSPAGLHTDYSTLLESVPSRALPELDADDVRMVLYTSGTTGRPKGVLHSHNSIHALICQLRDHWHVDPGDRFLVASPIAHIGGSIYAFECPLLLGTTAVLMERWDAAEGAHLMAAERCTHMAGATPFLDQLLTAADTAGTRLPDLEVFICGGASVPPALIRRAADYFERALVTRVYGSTEVPVTTVGALRPGDAARAADTDGRPGIAEIRLAHHDAAAEGSGEIEARGPQMLVGYLRADDEAESFTSDGFFRTGDLARLVDDEYLVVTGRAKDIIIRNGENISPKEIEDVLITHPGIAELAIVGVPDERTGEQACAVIVPGAAAVPDVAELRDVLSTNGIARFKAPERVVVWDALPKNDAGKVLKHQIRAALMSPAPTTQTTASGVR
ncbi:AMP-binding protein [Mycolicibacterium mengxianglii]|uniref:AMP-binding protein n=1 Tax=Mycolicibacterium mengxianglii TaxID=2736649 RepID=UPI0018D0B853|nr:AMP-binding protein [Mycolicibacterium mengxianglii]